MDTDRAAAVAAASPPGVVTVGDRTFVVRPLTGPEEIAVVQEFRRQVLAAAKDPLTLANERIAAAEKAGRPFSPTVVDALVRSAMAASSRKEEKAEPSDAEIAARAYDPDGMLWHIWFRLSRTDPAITLAWVKGQLPDAESRNAVLHQLGRVGGLAELDPKKA